MTATAIRNVRADADVVKLPTARTRRAREAGAETAAASPRNERAVSAKRRAAIEVERVALAGKIRVATWLACGSGSVSLVMTALSLTHLATGFAHVTACDAFGSNAMAVGIDLGFLTAELALILNFTQDPAIRIAARTIAIVTLVVSAMMNAFAFSGSPEPTCRAIGIALGLVIPVIVYALNQLAARQVAMRATLDARLTALEG